MTTTTDVWQKYATELTNLVTAGQFDSNSQVISFAGTTLSVDLGNANAKVINDVVYNIANTIPAYSPSYAAKGGLISSYASFLDAIDLKGDPNPNLDPEINNATTAFNNAQTNFIDVQTKAYSAWANFKTASGSDVSFFTWVQSNYPVYIQAKSTLQATESKLQQLNIQKYGQGYQIIANAINMVSSSSGALDITAQTPYNMAVASGATAPAGSGPAVLPGEAPQQPASQLVDSYAPAYNLNAFTTKYQEWQAASTNNQRTGGTISVSSSSKASQWSQFGWSANVGGLFGDFLSIVGAGSTSGQTTTFNTQSESFGLEVSFTGLGTFQLNQGKWYQAGLVQDYKNNLKPNSPDFFGEHGSMGLIPTEAIVGFEPEITLTLDQADYDKFVQTWQANASASLNLGPFRLGSANVSTYGSRQDINFDASSRQIKIGPVKSTVPLLLGVISTKI
ncbi:hypothetical protein tinsulaeT_10880 [Thalassotalea insulae]|uniref:Uncharacterized protein n=1 Tax=Thalassotalea insulae TaxID=2056778 RepID=A0ABQ6GP54_9GAMM|nr:hypothetical protein [Thalassotalea insulae]GLX77748.1 hypothetical protein tinsulaeT_10880 [Thalassotalea insulae]